MFGDKIETGVSDIHISYSTYSTYSARGDFWVLRFWLYLFGYWCRITLCVMLRDVFRIWLWGISFVIHFAYDFTRLGMANTIVIKLSCLNIYYGCKNIKSKNIMYFSVCIELSWMRCGGLRLRYLALTLRCDCVTE